MLSFQYSLQARYLTLTGAIFVLLVSPSIAAEPRSDLEEIVVTGSRTEPRTVLTSPVPIDVFSTDQLRSSGAVSTELGQAIANLAPSFNFPRQSNSGTSDHIRAGQLRGMSPDQTLVLVNGKRRHTSAVVNTETKIGRGTAAVDFNTIPMNAVKRIEVLRDGAGAQYGSDAIAGVINVILDDRPQGVNFNTSYGFHHTQLDPIGQTITDGETFTIDGDIGVSLSDSGFMRFGASYESRNGTNRAGFDQIPGFIPQTPANLALRGQRNYTMGDPDVEGVKLWANSEVSLDWAEIYAFGAFASRDTRGATFFRYPDDSRNVPAIYPDGFLPVTTGDNEDVSITAGARRNFGGWNAELSVTYGRNEFTYGATNSLNASLGPQSPTEFESGTYVHEEVTTNLDWAREVATELFAEPATLALGAQHRWGQYKTLAGEPASYRAGSFDGDIGAQGAAGLTPEDEANINRDILGAYADLSAQVTDRLFANIAGRYEHYSDFGDNWTGKLSAIYSLLPNLNVRGAVSNNVRAPALSQIAFADRTINFGEDRSLVTTRTLPVDNPIARALGATDLKPERSFNVSFGVTATLFERLSLSADVFRIKVRNRVTLSDRLFGPNLENFVQSLPGGGNIESVRFFTNAIDTRTQGVEFVAAYPVQAFGGTLNLTAAYSYAKTDITEFANTPSELTALNPDFRLIGVEEINTIEGAAPRSKLVTTAEWSNERWRLLGRVSRFGSTTRVFNFGGGFQPRQEYGAEISLDAEIGFQVSDSTEISVGGRNLWDNYPDRSNSAINFFGNLPYDILSPIGVNGRYLYARLSFRG